MNLSTGYCLKLERAANGIRIELERKTKGRGGGGDQRNSAPFGLDWLLHHPRRKKRMLHLPLLLRTKDHRGVRFWRQTVHEEMVRRALGESAVHGSDRTAVEHSSYAQGDAGGTTLVGSRGVRSGCAKPERTRPEERCSARGRRCGALPLPRTACTYISPSSTQVPVRRGGAP